MQQALERRPSFRGERIKLLSPEDRFYEKAYQQLVRAIGEWKGERRLSELVEEARKERLAILEEEVSYFVDSQKGPWRWLEKEGEAVSSPLSLLNVLFFANQDWRCALALLRRFPQLEMTGARLGLAKEEQIIVVGSAALAALTTAETAAEMEFFDSPWGVTAAGCGCALWLPFWVAEGIKERIEKWLEKRGKT